MFQNIIRSRSSVSSHLPTNIVPNIIDLPDIKCNPVYQAYQLLHIAFVVAPILAGLDKFFHLLVNWDQYLAPFAERMLGGHGHEFMLAAGVIEIIAGIGVWLKPKVFAYVVAAWLLGIIFNLLMIPGYYDVALRDLGLFLAALALGRLSAVYDRREVQPAVQN
ncbi:MAG: hypothetical protein AB7G28_02630 [Pirellulales bacterium]|jgi:hypothetical protein